MYICVYVHMCINSTPTPPPACALPAQKCSCTFFEKCQELMRMLGREEMKAPAFKPTLVRSRWSGLGSCLQSLYKLPKAVPGPQQHVKLWPFGLFWDVLGCFFTYLWGPGKTTVEAWKKLPRFCWHIHYYACYGLGYLATDVMLSYSLLLMLRPHIPSTAIVSCTSSGPQNWRRLGI